MSHLKSCLMIILIISQGPRFEEISGDGHLWFNYPILTLLSLRKKLYFNTNVLNNSPMALSKSVPDCSSSPEKHHIDRRSLDIHP